MKSVQLWTGRAGSGKSTRILDEIAALAQENPFGAPVWWIVPATTAFATERMLLARLPATVRIEVVTLRRLAERAADALAHHLVSQDGRRRQRMNQTGKRVIMAQVYEARAALMKALVRADPSFAFVDALQGAMEELEQYLVTQSDWERVQNRLSQSDLQPSERRALASGGQKLLELLNLKETFAEQLRAQGLWDGDRLYSDVTPYLREWDTLRQATVFLDGFSTWSPVETRFVAHVAQVAMRCVMALPMDGAWRSPSTFASGRQRDEEPFAPQTLRMLDGFEAACAELDVRMEWDVRSDSDQPQHAVHRFSEAPALGHLERYLYSFRQAPYLGQDAGHQIHLVAAQNPRVEVAGILQEMLRLVRYEGLSFGDIAVIAPNLGDYLDDLRDGFTERAIPHTMDAFPQFAHHPLARLVTAVLSAVRDGLTQTTIFRLLKTEFPGLARDEADWLEDYARRYEIEDEAAWTAEAAWTYASETAETEASERRRMQEDKRADALRRRWCQVFLPLIDRLRAPRIHPGEMASVLWALFEQVGARARVASWMVNEDASLSPLEASLHEQAWEFVVDLLNDCATAPPDFDLPMQSAMELMQSAIDECVLATIPGSVDAVHVTDSARAEGLASKVVFVIGALDGAFPPRLTPSGVWLDEERTAIERVIEKPFGVTTEQRQWDERYHTYTTLTRAEQQLWISYPLAGSDGKARRCASLVNRIKRMFAGAGVTETLWTLEFDGDMAKADVRLWNPDAALAWMGQSLRDVGGERKASDMDGTMANALVRWLGQDPALQARVRRVQRGTLQRASAKPLAPDLATKLFRGPTTVNVSQLETFSACPFQHFARYGLRVTSVDAANQLPAARGTLIHEALHRFVQQQLMDLQAWKAMSDGQATDVMRQVIQEILNRPQFASWSRRQTRWRVAEGTVRVLEHAAIVLTEHARHSTFEPRLLEFTFDDEALAGSGFSLTLPDGTKLRLRGRIDRVDVVAKEDRHAFRIVDYKSSQLNLDLTRVQHGLQLQLPVYAAMVGRLSENLFGATSEPAGMLYFPVLRRVSSVPVPDGEAQALETSLQNMKARGLMVEDAELVGWMDDRLVSVGESPLFGKVYNKDGTASKRAPVLTQSLWKALLDHALHQVVQMSQAIANGRIDVSPYRFASGETACAYCDYRSVCHVDARYDSSPFRRLSKSEQLDDWLTLNGKAEHLHE